MSQVAVSVVIPVYNAEKYLQRCLNSVVGQTLKGIEILCIDDGSTDKSWEIVQEFVKQDRRIIAIQQENSGAYVARNKAIEQAKGEYIGFVDSDDWVDADYFEKLYKAAKKNNADIARAYVKTSADNAIIERSFGISVKDYDNHYNVRQKEDISRNKLYIRSALWVAIYKRSVILEHDLLFPAQLRAGADTLFNIKFGYYSNKIVYTDTKTYYRRVVREGSSMTSFVFTNQGVMNRLLLLEEIVKFISSKPDYDPSIYVQTVCDSTSLVMRSLSKPQNLSRKTKVKAASTIYNIWQHIKHREDAVEYMKKIDFNLAQLLDDRVKLRNYILNTEGLKNKLFKLKTNIKRNTKRGIKAATPYGLIVLRRKYKTIKGEAKRNLCPICEQYNEFMPVKSTGGIRLRANCPNCGSLERHRLVWLFINRNIGLENLKRKSMLHVAAESMLEPKLREIVGEKYLTADYLVKADVKMDITNIKYKDNSFDIIMCNHVLEHVDDDSKAMREMYRVLKPGGWAIFLVPIADMPTTYENKKIKTDAGRLKHFGQVDHVRKYGRDYVDRLKSAGWNVDIYKAQDVANKKELKNMHLIEDAEKWGFTPTEIFFCTKQ